MKLGRLCRKLISMSESSGAAVVTHDLASRISDRSLGLNPNCLGKYSGPFQLGIDVNALTGFQFALVRRLTIAKEACAYIESQAHFLLAAESLHRNLILNGVELGHRTPDQRDFLLRQRRQIQ